MTRLRSELAFHTQQRMVGHELAEHLLLFGEQEPLVQLVPEQDPLVDLAEPGAIGARPEQGELPCGLGLAFGEDRRRDLLPGRLLTGLLHHPAARVPERVERAGEDERLEDALRQGSRVGPPAQIGEGLEHAARAARIQDRLHDSFTDVPDRRQAVPDRPTIAGRGSEVHVGLVDVRGKHLDLHAPARVQVVRLAVLVVLHRREDGRHVLDRVLGDQVRSLVRDEAVGARVGGGEPVVGERLDQVEQIGGEPLRDPLADAPRDEALPLLADELAFLLGHDLAERVRLPHGIARHPNGDLHDLLLIDHDAVGVLEHRLEVRMRIHHLAPAVLALGVLRVHPGVERSGTVERHERHQVFEPVGFEQLDQAPHPRRFHLEHAGGVPTAEHRVGLGVIQRDVVDVELGAPRAKVPQGLLDDRKRPQTKEVHLEQPELSDAVHVELRDHLLRLVARILRELEREISNERRVADHDAGRMDRVLAA